MRCQPEHGLTIFKRQTRGVEIMKFKLLVLIAVVMFNVVPVWAQANPVHTVGMDGVSFSFDAAIAQNVNIVAFAGDPVDLQAPGGPQAPYTEFVLYNGTPAPESAFDAAGSVRVYWTADIAAYPENQNRVIALQNLLAAVSAGVSGGAGDPRPGAVHRHRYGIRYPFPDDLRAGPDATPQ
jgi:hypothetical protein